MKEFFRWLRLRAYLKHKRKLQLLQFAKEHPDEIPTMLYYRLT